MDQVYLISLAYCGLLDQAGQNMEDIKHILVHESAPDWL